MRAVLWMFGALLSLFTISLLAKVLSPHYNTFEIMFYRSVLAFAMLIAALAVTGHWRDLHIRHLPLHFARNIVHFTAQNLWFYALAFLPLGLVITFEFTTPAWVIIIAALFLAEGFGIRRFWVIILSLIGVSLSTYPLFADATRPITVGGPFFAAFGCAIGFAMTTILTKRLTRIQTVIEILIMMTLMQGILAALVIAGQGTLAPMTLATTPYLLAIAFFGTSSHYCLTKALSLADASIVAPIDLLRLPLSILAGVLLFGDPFSPLVLLGAAIIIASNYFNIQRQAR